jgi:outer membrane immunogenic protein
MRAIILAAAGLLAIGAVGSAHAADMGPPPMVAKAPPPPPPSYYNWTGFYIGGNGGGGWGHLSATTAGTSLIGVETASGSSTSSGGLAGGQIGFNYQFDPHWVAGIEADGDWAHIASTGSGCSTFSASNFPAIAPVGSVASCATESGALNDFGTVRGRLGYAWNNVLLYGTGGWAWGNNSATHTMTCAGAGCPGATLAFTGGNYSYSNSLSGWTAGAGIEWGFLPNWTLRVEYLHLEFDNVVTNAAGSDVIAGFANTFTVHSVSSGGVDLVRVGVNYLFNFGGPLMAMR